MAVLLPIRVLHRNFQVLIHFHLHNPIMIGKKKTKDVQFYVEVMEASYALDNTRRSGYVRQQLSQPLSASLYLIDIFSYILLISFQDPDELEEEQRERALRNRMNQEFQVCGPRASPSLHGFSCCVCGTELCAQSRRAGEKYRVRHTLPRAGIPRRSASQ